MEKIEISTSIISYPMPCALIGAGVEGKANFLTVAYWSMVKGKPPQLMVALGKAHLTNTGIRQNGTFSVNIPSEAIAEATDYCGIVSGRKYDKSSIFEIFYGKLQTAPMIRECPYNLECKLVQTVDLETSELFIGEIVAAYSDDRYLTGGMPDLNKIAPFMLSIGDKKYIGLGKEIGPAWGMGKKLIPEGT